MDELMISGKRFISSRRAAKEYHYHSDYIGQLIRAGKITGQKVGRSWYVSEASLTAHLRHEAAETEKGRKSTKQVRTFAAAEKEQIKKNDPAAPVSFAPEPQPTIRQEPVPEVALPEERAEPKLLKYISSSGEVAAAAQNSEFIPLRKQETRFEPEPIRRPVPVETEKAWREYEEAEEEIPWRTQPQRQTEVQPQSEPHASSSEEHAVPLRIAQSSAIPQTQQQYRPYQPYQPVQAIPPEHYVAEAPFSITEQFEAGSAGKGRAILLTVVACASLGLGYLFSSGSLITNLHW